MKRDDLGPFDIPPRRKFMGGREFKEFRNNRTLGFTIFRCHGCSQCGEMIPTAFDFCTEECWEKAKESRLEDQESARRRFCQASGGRRRRAREVDPGRYGPGFLGRAPVENGVKE